MKATLAAGLAAFIAFFASGILSRLYHIYVSPPSTPPKAADALRVALLGAAKIAPHALLFPARTIPEISIVAVGASSTARAKAFADRWDIPLSGTYAQIIASDAVDAVYIALINGQHYEWAAAALRAGKHVLCEKPLTSNAADARRLERLARDSSLILMEAYHNLHHPLATRMRELTRSGELGQLVALRLTSGLPGPDGVVPILLSKLGLSPHLLQFGWRSGGARARSAKMEPSLGGGKFLGQGCVHLPASAHICPHLPTSAHNLPTICPHSAHIYPHLPTR